MSAYEHTKTELANVLDLRGDAIPIYERREERDGERARGVSYNVPFITIDEVGLDPISTQASDIVQVMVTIYSRPDSVEANHDFEATKIALFNARGSVRRTVSRGRVNDRFNTLDLPYVASSILIARRVPRV